MLYRPKDFCDKLGRRLKIHSVYNCVFQGGFAVEVDFLVLGKRVQVSGIASVCAIDERSQTETLRQLASYQTGREVSRMDCGQRRGQQRTPSAPQPTCWLTSDFIQIWGESQGAGFGAKTSGKPHVRGCLGPCVSPRVPVLG